MRKMYSESQLERLVQEEVGKQRSAGEGNIDLYYHSITIGTWHGCFISSSDAPIDSPQDLFLLAQGRYIPGMNGGLLVGTSVSDTKFADGTAFTGTSMSDVVKSI